MEPAGASEPLAISWERLVVRGAGGWIADLSANRSGVIVSGGDSARRGHAEAFVASYAADGSERFRVKLDEPRSTTVPPRAAAVSIASLPNGDAYVLSSAARTGGPTAVQLTLLDAGGKLRFTTPLELSGQASPKLVVDSTGDAIVVGAPAEGGSLAVAKYAPNGMRRWSKTFQYSGDVPELAATASGIVLAASFHGTATFGEQVVTHAGVQKFSCGSDPAECERPARALLVVELNRDGAPVHTRVLGSSAAVIGVSDLVALANERLLVTGELSGPRTEFGATSACELEAGLPGPEPAGFSERATVTTQRCMCRQERRDLFVAELAVRAEPVWFKTLALGEPAARLGATSGNQMIWGARLSDTAERDGKTVSAVWVLDGAGAVQRRTTTTALVRELAVGESGVYASDAQTLRRVSWGP